MRILCWTGAYWPQIGGVRVLLQNLLPALRERGHEIVVVTQSENNALEQEWDNNGFKVYRFPFWMALRSQDLGQIAQIITSVKQLKQQFQPDIVHMHTTGHTSFFHLNTLDAWRCPSLVTIHGLTLPESTDTNTAQGRMLHAADWVATCSQALLADVRRLAPMISERSSCIANALPNGTQTSSTPQLNSSDLLCLGRLVTQKGFDLAISAFASLAQRFPATRLVIAGDGPERPALERLVDEQGLSARVTFRGWVPPEQVARLMDSVGVVLMPSRSEPFGLVALQAAQQGRPVIATRLGGLPEVVADEETGLLVPHEDISALATAIARLLDDRQLVLRMGSAAQQRARKYFDWEQYVGAYATLYEKLIA